jgi:hypothetical protein
MQIARAAALLLSVAFFACGDDGGPRLIDSGIGNSDTGPKVCTAPAAIGATEIDVTDEGAGRFLMYYADIGDVGGHPTYLYMELYHSTSQPTLPATVDLAVGDANKSYVSCLTCFLAISFDANTGDDVAYYFQESGTITFPTDPITARHLSMTVSNLKLQEATFDQDTGDFVLNPTGECVTLNGTVDQDNVPNDWTCAAADYYGTNNNACNCACGAFDPDCRLGNTATPDCSGGTPVCIPNDDTGAACAAGIANDTCATPATLTPGTVAAPNVVSGTTLGARHNYNRGLETATCTKYGQPGPEAVYQTTLAAGVTYTVTLNGLGMDHDGSVAILGPTTDAATCSDMITNCVGGADVEVRGDPESFTFMSATGGTYFVIVDSYYRDDQGPFTISITGP